jgi:hypothetical protein
VAREEDRHGVALSRGWLKAARPGEWWCTDFGGIAGRLQAGILLVVGGGGGVDVVRRPAPCRAMSGRSWSERAAKLAAMAARLGGGGRKRLRGKKERGARFI